MTKDHVKSLRNVVRSQITWTGKCW